MAPHNVRVLATSSTVLLVEWEGLTPCSEVNGLIVQYRVEYVADGATGEVSTTDQPGEWNVTRAEALLTGLSPYTKYSVRVAAVNELGDVGLYSDPVTRWTLEDGTYNGIVVP